MTEKKYFIEMFCVHLERNQLHLVFCFLEAGVQASTVVKALPLHKSLLICFMFSQGRAETRKKRDLCDHQDTLTGFLDCWQQVQSKRRAEAGGRALGWYDHHGQGLLTLHWQD